MLNKYFLPLFLLASSCSKIGQTENAMSFVEQLKSVPIWTEKKSSDKESNVLYRLSVNTNGDIQYYSDVLKFVSSGSPSRAVYSAEDGSQSKVKKEFTVTIQSNSVILEGSPFSVKEFFRSPYEPIDRVFITNLSAVPFWYRKLLVGRRTYIRMIVESDGSHYPDDNDLKKSLHKTFVTAKSPTVAVFRDTYPNSLPPGVPPSTLLHEVEIKQNEVVWVIDDEGGLSWPRSHAKPEDDVCNPNNYNY